MANEFDDVALAELHKARDEYKVLDRHQLENFLKGYHGLWQFALVTDAGPRHVDLRLDTEYGLASGDVFRDAKRREWDRSFRSTAAYLRDGRKGRLLVLNCDATPDARRDGPDKIARLILRLRLEGARIYAAEARAISNDGNWSTDWFAEEAIDKAVDGETFRYSRDIFRRIRIDYYHDKELGSEDAERAERVMSDSVPDYLKAEGIEVDVQRKQFGKSGAQYVDIAGPLAEVQSSEDPWTFSLVFSGVSEDTQAARGRKRDVPFGRTVGLDGLPQRYRCRFGAIVFAGEMARSFKEAQAAGENPDGVDPDMRMAFTVMHELGHMLNLPHPWQRDLALRDDNEPAPASPTWMAYGSFHPFGAVTQQAYQNANSKGAKQERRMAHQKFLKNFFTVSEKWRPGYTPAEREHLRHAAFDQIAVGKRSFTDRLLAAPGLGKRALPAGLELNLELQGGDEDAPLLFASAAGKGYAHEPPSGKLELTVNGNEPDPLQFEFHTGAIHILAQGARSSRDQPTLPRPSFAVRVYNPLVHADNGIDWGVDYDDFLGARPKEGDLTLALPLIPPDFWLRFDRKLAFLLQAMFLAPDGRRVYSNTVSIAYERIEDLHGADAYKNHLKESVDKLRAAGLPAWRKQWNAAGVGLDTGPADGAGAPAAPAAGIARWKHKLGA